MADVDARVFGLIQRRDSAELSQYLAALDAAVPTAGAPAKLAKPAAGGPPPPLSLSTATVYYGLVSGDAAVVAALLSNAHVDPSMLDNGALIAAAEAGRSDIVELLLRDPRVNPLAEGGRALTLAAARGDTAMYSALLARVPVAGGGSTQGWDATLPLAVAARKAHARIVALTVARIAAAPASPALATRASMALVFAVLSGDVETVRALLALPASHLDVRFSNDAALLTAVQSGNEDIKALLLASGLIDLQSVRNSSHVVIDLQIANPKWWVPNSVDALRFYSAVVAME
ncbi:hypothetical protein HDU83_003232 [Entophlyctis luteolus]|nr:hypothetical protein HDU83_003232 [Entophlyctis luteolus]